MLVRSGWCEQRGKGGGEAEVVIFLGDAAGSAGHEVPLMFTTERDTLAVLSKHLAIA